MARRVTEMRQKNKYGEFDEPIPIGTDAMYTTVNVEKDGVDETHDLQTVIDEIISELKIKIVYKGDTRTLVLDSRYYSYKEASKTLELGTHNVHI